jgi:cytochrome c oxidase subunit 2
MTRHFRPRQLASAGFAVLLILSAACGGNYPNSTFQPTTEFNRDTTVLWDQMMFWGTVVFVIVEVLLLVAIVRYRRRPNSPEPKHVHGNTAMEITWTVLPMFILAIIAVPTVRQIWKHQAPAPGDALQVQVIGHQWWWEFRYPQYNFTTANELYMPVGRSVNFELRTADVIHSFWIPALGGKRDLVNNRTNYLWFTPDSTGENAFNGTCNEFCGTSHANMRFRAYTVSPENFETWARHQAANAVMVPGPAPGGASTSAPVAQQASNPATPQATPPAVDTLTAPPSMGYQFPADRLGAHFMPSTPIPAGLAFNDALLAAGDAQRGMAIYSRSACIGCHKVRGNPSSIGVLGPDLTHIASRHTIAAGLFPNDARHLARWIKNAAKMKPGAKMNVLGTGEYDPMIKSTGTTPRLSDEQIADIVAYLMTLK